MNPTISTKASNVLNTEVTRLLEKGTICEVGQVQVEYVSAMGLQPETIVSRLSLKLGGRLAHYEDSYRKIGTRESHIDVIRKGYKPTWIKSAP